MLHCATTFYNETKDTKRRKQKNQQKTTQKKRRKKKKAKLSSTASEWDRQRRHITTIALKQKRMEESRKCAKTTAEKTKREHKHTYTAKRIRSIPIIATVESTEQQHSNPGRVGFGGVRRPEEKSEMKAGFGLNVVAAAIIPSIPPSANTNAERRNAKR